MKKEHLYQYCALFYVAGLLTKDVINYFRMKGVADNSANTDAPWTPAQQSVETMSVRELRQVGKELKVPNYYNIKKTELVNAIEKARTI